MKNRSTSPRIRLDRSKLLGFAPLGRASREPGHAMISPKPAPRDPRRAASGGKPAPLVGRS